jgi:hypothetical protein
MMALTNQELKAYLEPLTGEQKKAVTTLRELIRKREPHLKERIAEQGMHTGMILYTSDDGTFVYGVGPKAGGETNLHLMPYYGSVPLQKKHGMALKGVLSGKSCLSFKDLDDLPMDSVDDIVNGGAARMAAAIKDVAAARAAKGRGRY